MRKALDPIAQTALTRRAMLRFGVAGLGFAAAGLPLGAQAFTLQEADAPTTAAFHNACGSVAYHQKLAEEVRAILIARHMPADAAPQAVACPVCGCKVAVK